jgi:lysophospholipase L1-like esterase
MTRTEGALAFVGIMCVAAACAGRTADAPATEPAPSPEAGAAEASVTDTTDAAPSPTTARACFADLAGPVPGPDYEPFAPVLARGCAGTHHQTITGVERVVFLGDSITAGTPPTPTEQYYANVLAERLKTKFGANLEVASCAAYGARFDDLLAGKGELASCFPGATEDKRTLVVMTMGGNDVAAWAKAKLDTATATAEADKAVGMLRAAVDWLKDPVRFPKGSFVVFGNVYEYTDTSGDLSSCPAASIAGLSGTWPDGAPAVVHFQEQMMKVAVETKTDLVFLLENFCGHGFKADDPSLQCYRGPGTPEWFDFTCYHPNPEGHAEIAKLFGMVIDG